MLYIHRLPVSPSPALPNPSPAEQAQGSEKTQNKPQNPKICEAWDAERLPALLSEMMLERQRDIGMSLLAAGEPGSLRSGRCPEEGRDGLDAACGCAGQQLLCHL